LKETYLDGNINKIIKRYRINEKRLLKEMLIMPPDKLNKLIAKQKRRAARITDLMRARIREWEMLANGGVGANIRGRIQAEKQHERYARAKAEGRPMVECFTVEREVQHG